MVQSLPPAGLLIRFVAATVWAAVLVILGLSVTVEGPGPLPLSAHLFWPLGIAAVTGGQFIFMVLVADRIIRGTHRHVVVLVEVCTFAIFLLSATAAVAIFMMGSGL